MKLNIFMKMASVSFQKSATYRFDYFMGIMNGFLYVFIFTSIWRALYTEPGMTMGGFDRAQMIAYAVMAMCTRIAFTMDDTIVYKKVQDGSISIDLLRPVPFFLMVAAENVGHSLFHALARGVPTMLISLLMFGITLPMEPKRLLAYALSCALGYLVLVLINFVIGLLAFWFVEIFPFMLFKYSLITLFSGGIIPIDFFPDWSRPFIDLLPFQQILYIPTIIITGRAAPADFMPLIATQAVWVMLLGMTAVAVWKSARGKLVIQGG